MGNGSADGIIDIVEEDGRQSLRLSDNGDVCCYYMRLAQVVEVPSHAFDLVTLSFDWKVLRKGPTYGTAAVEFLFQDESGSVIATIKNWETPHAEHTLQYMQGGLADSVFFGERGDGSVFDWRTESYDTNSLPGLDLNMVSSVKVHIWLGVNTSGGEFLVDDVSVRFSTSSQANGYNAGAPCTEGQVYGQMLAYHAVWHFNVL